MDEDKLLVCIKVACWPDEDGGDAEITDLTKEAERLMEGVVDASAASMPRVSEGSVRRKTYWWTREIADLRSESANRGRHLHRAIRRKGSDHPDTRRERLTYGEARARLRTLIRDAKRLAWEAFIATLHEDPWGRPYKTVFKKLSNAGPPMMDSLDPQQLDDIVGCLFPGDPSEPTGGGAIVSLPMAGAESPDWTDELGVTGRELEEILKRLRGSRAPGPDRVHWVIWALSFGELAGALTGLFSACLKRNLSPDVEEDQFGPPSQGRKGPL